ncbi:MAG TPA: sugar ABC transporter substrate-binding protein [Kofleriaceae bacterium]|nr:sugar ABC transporter substrate-binding protein [Kofleriaceae bacterium]
MRPPAAGLLAAALLAVLPACASQSSDEVVLELWAVGREGELVSQLTRDFEASHPGIRVEVQKLPWIGAHEKLLTAVVGDAPPDVAQMGNTWIPEFAAIGALSQLDEEIAGSRVVAPADYFAGVWNTNVVDGRVYGVPWYVDTRLLFYRRDILAEAGYSHPPRSWPEWREMMGTIQRRAAPDHFAVLMPLNEFEPLLALGLQQDEPLLRDGGRWGNFRSAGFRRALAFYVDAFQSGLAPKVTNLQVSNVWDEFGRGFFAFYISGPWQIGEFKRRLPDAVQGAWATAPLPGPDGPGASIASGASLVVFAGSPHKQAAWQLIEYLSRPDIQLRLNALGGDLPPRRTPWNDPALASDVHAAAFRDQLERVEPTPSVPEWQRIATELYVIGEQAAHGRITVDQAAAELDARADRILEKRRWVLDREASE